jgi:hypothetical protein
MNKEREKADARWRLPRLIIPKPMVAERQNIAIMVAVVIVEAVP